MTTPDVLNRLRKIAGLLASSHEGEQLAAVNRANALLAQHKLTWGEVIGGEFAPMPRPRHGRHRPEPQPPDIDIDIIPDNGMSDDALQAYGKELLYGHNAGAFDLGDVTFLTDVLRRDHWTIKQRAGLVRSLRRAWFIRNRSEDQP